MYVPVHSFIRSFVCPFTYQNTTFLLEPFLYGNLHKGFTKYHNVRKKLSFKKLVFLKTRGWLEIAVPPPTHRTAASLHH